MEWCSVICSWWSNFSHGPRTQGTAKYQDHSIVRDKIWGYHSDDNIDLDTSWPPPCRNGRPWTSVPPFRVKAINPRAVEKEGNIRVTTRQNRLRIARDIHHSSSSPLLPTLAFVVEFSFDERGCWGNSDRLVNCISLWIRWPGCKTQTLAIVQELWLLADILEMRVPLPWMAIFSRDFLWLSKWENTQRQGQLRKQDSLFDFDASAVSFLSRPSSRDPFALCETLRYEASKSFTVQAVVARAGVHKRTGV
jgi:hypothetical protein